MNSGLVHTIKTNGYWRVSFQPLIYKKRLLGLSQCREIVDKNQVSLRGWRYPFVPIRVDENMGCGFAEHFYWGWIDSGMHKEFWRMYDSGQFLHYKALREDWYQGDLWAGNLATRIKPGTVLGVTGSTVYQITEAFQFLSRLASAGLYEEGMHVYIGLYNAANRTLWIEDDSRMPFSVPRVTHASKIEYDEVLDKDDILKQPNDIAYRFIEYVFERFGWNPLPVETIKKDQESLLSGRRY